MGKENKATKTSFWNSGTLHIDITPISENWNLLLNGTNKVNIDMKTFIAASARECYGTSWKDADGLLWEGIPLWRLVGVVDDSLNPGEDIFIDTNYNDNLADKGYTVRLIASDGYYKIFESQDIKRNNNFLIAWRVNGQPISVESHLWPLRLVGPGLFDAMKIGALNEIKVILP
ncbi:MAG: molybdopterin-dependent oxidoreductase, partial [Chloroflexi bacterium]|nr:molybdopterin-dependent oxidoreductase [Chloroflexota bacterium]